jgi:hypothetical protein
VIIGGLDDESVVTAVDNVVEAAFRESMAAMTAVKRVKTRTTPK